MTIRVNNMDMPWSCENSCTQEAESREDPPVEVHSKMQTATCLSRRGWNFCPGLSCCHRVISTALDCLSVFFGMTPVLIQSIHSSRWSPILSQSLLFTCTQRTDSLSLSFPYTCHTPCFCLASSISPNCPPHYGGQDGHQCTIIGQWGWLGDAVLHTCSKWHRIRTLKWFNVNTMPHLHLPKEHLKFWHRHSECLDHCQITFIWPSCAAALHEPISSDTFYAY